MPAVAAEVTQIAPATPDGNQSTDQSLIAQTIGNPTENNSSSLQITEDAEKKSEEIGY